MLVLVVVAGVVLGLATASQLSVSAPGYREGLISDERPLSLNPLVGATDAPVRDLGELLYRRLLRLDDRALPTPDLASAVTVSADGLTYHLPLRPAIRWSDGHPISASDVLGTVALVQSPALGDPATAAPWSGVHASVEGAGVAFSLPTPRASFESLLSELPILPVGGLSPPRLAALPKTAATALATSGPYMVASSSAAAVMLVASPAATVAPRIARVELDLFSSFAAASDAFHRGQVDGVMATDPAQRSQLTGVHGQWHDLTTFRFVDLLFNERNPVLADPVIRQAIAQTIDRAALIAGPLTGMAVPAVGAIPPGVAWATAPVRAPAAAPAAAAQALDNDGWHRGRDAVLSRGTARLSVRLVVGAMEPLPRLAAGVASQLLALGMDVQVQSLAPLQFRQVLTGSGDFDMALADWDNGPDPDVTSYWRSTAIPPAGYNVSAGAPDPFLDQALDRLATLADIGARQTAAATVVSQLAEDLPAVFIDAPQVSLVVRPGVKVSVPPVGDTGARFANIAQWSRG